jgi:outer membrane biosynthesis protein TonB
MARSQTNRKPALAVSALLHAAAIAAAVISWQWGSKHMTLGQVVPVTIVNGPPADMAPAIEAPEPSPATAEEPVPQATAPPTPVAPPAPKPTPPAPQPKQAVEPTPKPTPAPGKPTAKAVAKPAPTGQGKPAKGLDLSALAASLSKSKSKAKPSKSLDLSALAASLSKPAQGAKGANKPRTAAQAETGAGTQDHLSASDVNGLVTKLQRLWNPNCDVEGAAGINVKVRISFNHDGTLSAPPQLVDRNIDPTSESLLGASAHRALSAVVRGAPYTELPPNAYGDWKVMVVNFNAKQACARR